MATAMEDMERSIPAHAGKPNLLRACHCFIPVYPRPRGEAVPTALWRTVPRGLSPPTRGSQGQGSPGPVRPRSIPAHAGKPSVGRPGTAIRRVYPRPRGEAASIPSGYASTTGLSPPTRGSLDVALRGPSRRGLVVGSIPAHAGKPLDINASLDVIEVYPRPRGEALSLVAFASQGMGLSPPTRGSRRLRTCVKSTSRSIPAHAGKPSLIDGVPLMATVYPRPRGEARLPLAKILLPAGLSPPTRGSLQRRKDRVQPGRSIPAHAGKPHVYERSARSSWVYPRPRGEAWTRRQANNNNLGLSPPTRGSRRRPG